MDNREENRHKPHCLVLPFPIQGHINPMLQFSKRLSHKGIRITLAATKHLFKTTQQFSGSISVETISDGFDEGKADVDLDPYLARFEQVGTETLSELLDKLRDSGRPVDCVIYDPFLPWAVVVAKKHGLVGAAFFTQSSSVNSIYYNVYKGQLKVPLLDKEIAVAGLPLLEISDVPSFVRDQDSHPGSFELVLNQFRNVEEADFVFVNSFYELEEEVTDLMAKILPVKTIGPTTPSMYLDKRLTEDKDYDLSIFKPVNSCMKWLEERTNKSVIYVSFGSMAKLEGEQMEELALGLKMTNKYFLWVVRSSEESKLPKSFVQETQEKGLIVSWCPQLEVLAHDAIGCFITHCGWNSTLEALSLGVPMVAVPWWSDQSTNAKLVMDVWKMGIRARPDVKDIVGREEIVRCIKHVMEGEEGNEVRKNAKKWRELARKAVDEGGSSDRNIQEFLSTLESIAPK
ncbi:UDP-glycosyltransferase 74F2-like [Sesamum indicum]|uniref:Glycosyltransferase n=1 Tax=Sesamum indicum TaxID=4182 RepID=A0A6I9TM23_SESIN|nr:UDP-glycosyltransferase 74F2-like [Sesamum indicum]